MLFISAQKAKQKQAVAADDPEMGDLLAWAQ